ncbi:hypothetical protein A1A1_17045 [Planococcus antarcticus DSM 14505]|uniref:Uncharacterized protein n=1 Tax=Planococcus antarcticus DSM 14505 TaxID=1185653 RepID=A0AA87II49_9BACL|nr:hypothetical protein A1A1_17045 [Planococcus antarcticus DSM 14505]
MDNCAYPTKLVNPIQLLSLKKLINDYENDHKTRPNNRKIKNSFKTSKTDEISNQPLNKRIGKTVANITKKRIIVYSVKLLLTTL